jgi:hypothetical protein
MLVFGCSSPRVVGPLFRVFSLFLCALSRLFAPFGLSFGPFLWVGPGRPSRPSVPSWRLFVVPCLGRFGGRPRSLALFVSFGVSRGRLASWFWPVVFVLSVLCVAVSSVAFPAWVVSWVCVVVAGAVVLGFC